MKSVIRNSIILLSLVFVFISCKDDGPDTSIDSVKSLIAPANNYSVALQPTGGDLFFEWESVNENGILYQVIFDLPSGDFSSPVYAINSDNNGSKPSISLSQRDLNKIARLMGMKSSETGSFKWTVLSIRGLNTMKAAQERTLTVKRMSGFDELPVGVYLTGAASETGTNISDAISMQRIEDGVFEIYSRLTEGQSYSFVDDKSAAALKFYYDPVDDVIKEDVNNVNMTVSKTGVYRIQLDFTTGAAQYNEVKSFHLYFCPDNVNLFELPYVGNGIFKATSQPVTFKQEGWGRDERYKFRMYLIDSDGGEFMEVWGTKNNTDSRPSGDSPPSYYHMMQTADNQWDQKWKFHGDMDYGLVDVTAYFQAGAEYTHSVVKVGNQ